MKKIHKYSWWSRFARWITYYKVDLDPNFVLKNGRCPTCDANKECAYNFKCPCDPNQQLKTRPINPTDVKLYW